MLLLCEAAAAAAAVTFFLHSEAWYRTGVMRSIVASVLCVGVSGVAVCETQWVVGEVEAHFQAASDLQEEEEG